MDIAETSHGRILGDGLTPIPRRAYRAIPRFTTLKRPSGNPTAANNPQTHKRPICQARPHMKHREKPENKKRLRKFSALKIW